MGSAPIFENEDTTSPLLRPGPNSWELAVKPGGMIGIARVLERVLSGCCGFAGVVDGAS
jgi:hypothetical protein